MSDRLYRSSLSFSYYDEDREIDITIRIHEFVYNSLLDIQKEIEKITPIGTTYNIHLNAR